MTPQAAGQPSPPPALLEVIDLHKRYPLPRQGLFEPPRYRTALAGVSLTVAPGETLGLVGESGSGKSTLVRLILRLEDPDQGELRFEGLALHRLTGRSLRRVRPRLQAVFQDPYTTLTPHWTVRQLIGEPMLLHRLVRPRELQARVLDQLARVGLGPELLERYPHELSGGQRQRVGIARALALRPRLLLCDEPTSALDVSVQAQLLDLLARLREEEQLTLLLVSHDLRVVRQLAQRVAVLQQGQLVEDGPVGAVIDSPRHPYTQALLRAVPRLGRRNEEGGTRNEE